MTIHKAKPEAMRVHLITFFESLERKPNGLLTKQSREKRDGFLSAMGITNEYARQIMKAKE